MTTLRQLLTLTVVLGLAAAALVAPPALSAAPSSDPLVSPGVLEPVDTQQVPLPADVLGMSESVFATDNEHLVAAFVSRSSGDRPPGELGVVDPSTGAVACLTCGLPIPGIREANRPNLGKPQVFQDGRRVLFRTGERPDSDSETPLALFTGDAGMFRYYILECFPSVVACDEAQIVRVALPSEGLGSLTQNREARISPDGRWFAWTEVKTDGTRMTMGRLDRASEKYVLEDLYVINPEFTLREGASAEWRKAMPLYEFKNFGERGRTAYYASFHDAQNYDVFEVDLATGEHRRVTTDIEWNEGTVISPDGTSFVNGSSRGRSRMAPFALVPRPPFVDFGVYVLTGRFSLGGANRRCLLEPWLLDSAGQAGEYFGQPLNPENDPGWGSHGPGSWAPDGTRYTFWERNYAAGADPESRIVVAHLPARAPSPATQPAATPTPTWATPRRDWNGALDKIGIHVIHGEHSGRAVLTLGGLNPNSTGASVVYHHYSDDGKTFLDGHETSLNPFALLAGTWNADLRVTGEHTGRLEANILSVQKGLTGRVRSEYDGRVAHGLPDESCDPEALPAPTLQIETVARGEGELVLRVTARPIDDDTARAVRGVDVTIDGHTSQTDASGVVRLADPGGTVTITAAAPGFRSTEQTMP